MKHSSCIALVALILALPGLALFSACSVPSPKVEAKAAIIDQVWPLQPNQAFVEEITQYLEAYDFKVDTYHGDEVTVDFYRRLPTYGYKLIIFRAHSGLLGSQEKIFYRTALFTNELYVETRHVTEQLTEQLAMARMSEHHPWVFAIGPKFITRSMEGRFPNTVIVMMGCSSLLFEGLAQAFIQKGASTYMGWDATVGLDYVDNATITLIEKLFSEEVTVEEAIAETMQEKGPDPNYGALVKYYPPESGNKTLRQLIE